MGKYSKEFKLEALRIMDEQERPIAEIARDLGIKREILYRWRDDHRKNGNSAFKGSGRPLLDQSDELVRLRKENAMLKEERDILKKAAAYFARDLK